MTKQKIFNLVVKGLASQGFKQSISNGSCAYRGVDGLKCAAGYLITDKNYTVKFEGVACDPHGAPDTAEKMEATCEDIGRAMRRSTGILPTQTKFVRLMQIAHDEGASPEDMKANLRSLASVHGLRIPQSLKVAQ